MISPAEKAISPVSNEVRAGFVCTHSLPQGAQMADAAAVAQAAQATIERFSEPDAALPLSGHGNGAWRGLYLSNVQSTTLVLLQLQCKNPSQNAPRGAIWTISGSTCVLHPPSQDTGKVCAIAALPAAQRAQASIPPSPQCPILFGNR